MLHHEPTSPKQSSAAAQHRVTPEELAQALAALDTRDEQKTKTIAIGEAVDQLNLRATPDEIWAEVQAQRQKHSQIRSASSSPQKRLVVIPIGVILIAVTTFFSCHSDHPHTQRLLTTRATVSTLTAAQPAQAGTATPAKPPTVDPNVLVQDSDVKRMLGEIPEGHPVTANLLLTRDKADYVTLADIDTDANDNQDTAYPTIVKYHHAVYLCGFIEPASDAALERELRQGQTLVGYTGVNGGKRIMLRLDNFKAVAGASDGQTDGGFFVQDAHLDTYAWAKW